MTIVGRLNGGGSLKNSMEGENPGVLLPGKSEGRQIKGYGEARGKNIKTNHPIVATSRQKKRAELQKARKKDSSI